MIDLSFLDRHEKIALSFSGGKDSLAVVYLLRPVLDRLTIYHLDTGDLLPEIREIVAHVQLAVPRFVRIQTDVTSWIAQHGLPTDLMPHSSHPIGHAMGEDQTKLVPRYDCCWANLMGPIYQRVIQDGNTLLIRGTKSVDMKKLPVRSGQVTDEGIELWYPIQDWSHAEVFSYLRSVGAPIARVYEQVTNSPECARCSAWWGEGRNVYLAKHHPALWEEYRDRLELVAAELDVPFGNLRAELARPVHPPLIQPGIVETSSEMAWHRGVRVLQGNRLAPTDAEHVGVLLRYMDPPANAIVLDIGSGFGAVAQLMLDARPDLRFSLVNNSPAQLKRTPVMEGISPTLGDMHRLPYSSGIFDGAMFLYSLCHADTLPAFREAARVVRPGGFLFVYDYERLGGDNIQSERALGARFYGSDELEKQARSSGWELEKVHETGGDDSLFRELFADDARYESIFRDLRPTIWRFEKVRAH